MMKKVPKRRFKGFLNAGDWEQRKLGELGKTFNGLTGKTKKDFGHGDAQYITYLNVFQNTISDLSMTERIEIDKSQNTVQYGDILFTTSSETPEEVGMSSVWLGEKPNTYLNSFCFGYRPTVDIDHQFMGNLLRSPHVRNEMKILAQGISRYNISKNKVMDLEITLPSKEEQKLIGSILNHIDSQLTLHQRKLEKLQATKKALLYELFPIENSRRPKRRFKGFTDDWEQCKLGDIVKSYSGGTPTASNKEYYGGDIPFIRSAEINSDTTELYITQKGLDNSSAKIVDKGTILYAMYGATSGEVGISKINGAINQAILAMRPLEYNGKIIEQYLRKNKKSIIGKYLQGGQGNLSASIILELPIQLPGLEESNQIANFLESFDNLITLHQRKLEKLKNLKAAYLNEMFV